MYEVLPQSNLEQRVGVLAVTLALEPDFEPGAAGDALAEAAKGNPTALRRALGRVLTSPSRGQGIITRRAAVALRVAIQKLAPETMASQTPSAHSAGHNHG